MRIRLSKSLLAGCLLAAVGFGCGNAKLGAGGSGKGVGGGGSRYGKAGPGEGESCYIGRPAGPHSCLEVAPNDEAGMTLMQNACAQNNGTRAHGTCKTNNFVGTCGDLRTGAAIKIRYYQMPVEQARSKCEANGGTLRSSY